MKKLGRNRKALSAPVTTMILLVVPVMLTGGTVMYAYQIISNETQLEILRLYNQHIWIYGNGTSFAAIVIDNAGGRDALIDKIEVRGVESPWTTVHYLKTSSPIPATLNCPNATNHSWAAFQYTENVTAAFAVANADIPLASGNTLIIFMKNPDNITPADIGKTVCITVFTMNAHCYLECNVQSADTAP
jgi:hypothetical protein